MDGLFDALNEARTSGKIGAFGVSSTDLRVLDAVIRVRKCRIVQTAVNPRTTEALMTFLNSTRESEDLELVANSVLVGGSLHSIETSGQALNPDSLAQPGPPSEKPRFTKAQLLIRHAAALNRVRVVLVGTSDPAHLAENVAALVTPATYEDVLT